MATMGRVSKLDSLAALVERLGTWRPWRAIRAALPLRWLTILTYHRVHPPVADYAFDRGVLDSTPTQFERQMRLLGKDCSPISLAT